MKIERINENQIRCTLTSFDLSVRNLNLGELAYGSEKARNLFREMIQKASNEVGFEAEDIPLMVEAIPLSNESVMLVITKIEDPEELDTRFAKFSPSADEDLDSMPGDLASELLEGADGLLNLLGIDKKEEPEAEEPKEKSSASSIRIYCFQSLDQISDAARTIGQVYDGENTLYKKPDTRQYYLVIRNTPDKSLDFSRVCNLLAEYGSKIHQDYASEAYYREHYEVLIEGHALQSLAKL
ncbi:MAG TPA: adaptor protein MecA [Lachnoclostridium sp.]|uniref:Adapter protein MecA 1/2 n=1 Tax=[Clostridium] celerecrescens 18A TaxID=1286362 RepID=A0A2M8Z947_9FIRM|nr:adaptor protein MecA [Lacrimispora celerecrescens]PJJ29985.1 adapter protein MecA 1/2 [[Clostridium] celerecrescens 18A]HBE86223.1 adaptor protein MecA [Lachnoclostridium sp.]